MNPVKQIRIDKKIKQKDLAEAAGIRQATLSEIENDQTKNPGIETMKAIAKALNVSLDDLVPAKDGNAA